MIRRDFLRGLIASGALAAGRGAMRTSRPTSSSLLNQGFVRTSVGKTYFEVHGNPAGFNVLLTAPVISRISSPEMATPANIKLQTEIKEGYIGRLGDRYKLLMSDYPQTNDKVQDQNETPLTVEAVCKDYLAIADAVSRDAFAAVGYSWGGNSILQLATRSRRVAGLVVGGWPALGGPYELTLQYAQKLLKENPELHELGGMIAYYQSLQGWPERTEIAKLTCPRLNFVDVTDVDNFDFIGRFRGNKRALQEMGWVTVEVNGGNGHNGGLRPDIACPVIRGFLDKHFRGH